MKLALGAKGYIVLAVLIALSVPFLLCCATNTAFAEEQNPISYVLPDDSDYYEFDSPSLIDVNDSVLICDGDKIKAFNNLQASIPADVGLSDIALYDNYVIALIKDADQTTSLVSYNLLTGDKAYEFEIDATYPPIALSVYGNKLYYITVSMLYCYDLSAENGFSAILSYPPFGNAETISRGLFATAEGAYIYTFRQKLYLYNGQTLTAVFSGDIAKDIDTDPKFVVIKQNDALQISYIIDDKLHSYRTDTQAVNTITLDYTPNDIAYYNNVIYLTDSVSQRVLRYSIEGIKQGYYGSYGDELDRQNKATALASYGDKIYVADDGNKRLVIHTVSDNLSITSTQLSNIENVTAICAYSDGCYLLSSESNGLKHYTNGNVIYTDYAQKLIHIATSLNNELFALTENSVLGYQNGTFKKLFDVSGFTKLYVNNDGGLIYLENNTGLHCYTTTGTKIDYLSFSYEQKSLTAPLYVRIDNKNNLILAYSNSFVKFLYEDKYAEPLTIETGVSALSFALSDRVYLLQPNRLASLPLSYVGYQSEGFSTVTPPNVNVTTVVKLNKNELLLTVPHSYSSYLELEQNSYMLKKGAIAVDGVNYFYVEYKNANYYVLATSVNELDLEQSHPDLTEVFPIHYNVLNVYSYPSTNAEILFSSINYPQILTVIRRVGVDNGKDVWGWLEVRYQDRVGYVDEDFVAKYEQTLPPAATYFAKVKSDGINSKVIVYQDSNMQTAAFELNDGDEVQLYGKLDQALEYTYVVFNGQKGYIKTSNLITKGLTSGQTLAIVLASLVVIGTVIFIVFLRSRRRERY